MHIYVVSIGTKMPPWVGDGFNEYAQRLPRVYGFKLIEIDPVKRSKTTPKKKILELEGDRLLAVVPVAAHVIALDERGTSISTKVFAQHLGHWQASANDTVFLIGGADGLSAACLKRANEKWSLSALTFPHAMVRVILTEQLYRAWSLLNQHPYHRA